jgi:hypothetical protein
MNRVKLLEYLTNEARTFRKDRTAVCKNRHLTGIYEIPDQELVDGILVAFINHIGMDQCIDYALSVDDL